MPNFRYDLPWTTALTHAFRAFMFFTEYAQPVASLVLLADEDPNWLPAAFHNDVLGTVMGISFAIAKLTDYGALAYAAVTA